MNLKVGLSSGKTDRWVTGQRRTRRRIKPDDSPQQYLDG